MIHKYLLGVALVAFATCFSGCVKEEVPKGDQVVNYVEVGDPVPAFTVSNGKGGSFSSSSFMGKRSLLVLFNTECKDCQRELPVVEEVWSTLSHDANFQVIAIGREETRASIDAYWTSHQLTIPSYVDAGRAVFSLFANSTIPRLYIINKQGVITWMAIEKLGTMTAADIIGLL